MGRMAEAALSPLLRLAFDKLVSPILEEFALLRGLCEDIETLRSTLSAILIVLEDVEQRQLKDKDVKNWPAKLKDVSYNVEDILDKSETEALGRKVEIEGRFTKKIQEIRGKLGVIAEEQSKFHLKKGNWFLESTSREEIDSFVMESDVYGREEDKERSVQLLLNMGNKEEASIIAITGMGGLGKTTLAQLTYNDVRVEEHFDLRIWRGKEIVKKCGGVPLAAKALGSLMRFKMEERKRQFLKDNEIWNIPEEENCILPALRLRRPHTLLWMAEGFIQPSRGRKPMEDIGREYFNDLLSRSFFQDPSKDDNGNILPRGMRKMISLRHLIITGRESLTHTPTKIGELKFLQTLLVFVVGEESRCNKRELKDLNLGGELKIQKLENVRGGRNSREAKLSEKGHELNLAILVPKRNAYKA
ncbi:hypothetical protein ACLOJK_000743 [Asimina triloba]